METLQTIKFHRHHCSNGKIRAFVSYICHPDQSITLASMDQDSGAALVRMFPDQFLPENDFMEYGGGKVILAPGNPHYNAAYERARQNNYEAAEASAINRDYEETGIKSLPY